MKRVFIFILVVAIGLAVAGCGGDAGGTGADGKLSVVAGIFPEYDFARAIVGDKAKVKMLVAPGGSVHSYDPSPADMVAVGSADIFICTGASIDGWVDTLLASVKPAKTTVLRMMDITGAVEEETQDGMEPDGDGDGGEDTEYDEHVWTSPKNAVKMLDAILAAVCEKDPENADFYTENAALYRQKLQDLDSEFREITNNAVRKKIVMADKFPFLYFVREYGLTYAAAFPGCSDQSDASPKTVAGLIDTVKNEGIPCVYYVELSTKNVAKTVSEATKVPMLELHSCQNVTRDDFNAGVTYAELMKRNAENLKAGLY